MWPPWVQEPREKNTFPGVGGRRSREESSDDTLEDALAVASLGWGHRDRGSEVEARRKPF